MKKDSRGIHVKMIRNQTHFRQNLGCGKIGLADLVESCIFPTPPRFKLRDLANEDGSCTKVEKIKGLSE